MKSNTQNAKIEAITEKTLVLGIDVGSATRLQKVQDRCLESCQISAESSELSVLSEPAMPAFVELPVATYSCKDKPAAVISCPNFKIEISESVSEAFLLKLIGVMKHA